MEHAPRGVGVRVASARRIVRGVLEPASPTGDHATTPRRSAGALHSKTRIVRDDAVVHRDFLIRTDRRRVASSYASIGHTDGSQW